MRTIGLGRVWRAFLGLGTTSLLCALHSGALSAQQAGRDDTGRIVGRVVDGTTEAAVEGVFVAIVSLERSTVSGPLGEFTFEYVPSGTYELRLRHIAFGTHSIELTVARGQTTRVDARLQAAAIEVEPVVVEIERRPRYLESVGYYERQERGWGTFFDPSWVETRNVGFTRADRFVEFVKGRSPALGCAQTPVYLDGRRIMNEAGGRRGAGNNLLAELSTNNLGAVELYSTGHGVPLFALNDTTLRCGAVLLWSDLWGGEEDIPQIQVVLCEPERSSGAVTLGGSVRDALTDVPLPGATVSLLVEDHREETLSDRAGRFRFCDLDRAGGLAVLRGAYAEQAGPGMALDLSAPPDSIRIEVPVSHPGQVAGRVIDRLTRRPLRGADVTLEGTKLTARTDERGRFRLPEIPPGDYALVVSHVGYPEVRETVSVRSRRTTELTVELERPPGG